MLRLNTAPLLCLKCRNVGHKTAECPTLPDQVDNTNVVTKLSPPMSEVILQNLTTPTDGLCQRCAQFHLLSWLGQDIEDELLIADDGSTMRERENKQQNSRRWLDLGSFSSIVLHTACPLCRIIFRIFPVLVDSSNWEAHYFLRPVRSYNRLGWYLPAGQGELGKHYASFVSVECVEDNLGILARHFGEAKDQMALNVEHTFCLSNVNPAPNRPGLSARKRPILCDMGLLKSWIDRCEETHGGKCRVAWSHNLLSCKMVDVESRAVVDCPPNCRYLALSYVWGGVAPEPGALQDRSLPQTIEDAITFTKCLGLKFLWVDALCIDQCDNAKQAQQLALMDQIYLGSWATIVALHGTDANSGLRGVSPGSAREAQGVERIHGSELLTLFPTIDQEVSSAKYSTRAWTLQEFILCPRRFLFAKHQVFFVCNIGQWSESIDETLDPVGISSYNDQPQAGIQPLPRYQEKPELRRKYADQQYRQLIEIYTGRQMTNDIDSENACLGLLSFLQKSYIPTGFVWGLPLKEFPQALRWCHPRGVKPRRRLQFPSWSFVGWEARAIYLENLDLAGSSSNVRYDESVDQLIKFVAVDGNVLTLDGFLLRLEIRNNPFNMAYIPGTDIAVGSLKEGNVLHSLTLPAGIFDFVLVERLRFRYSPDSPIRDTLYMVMLHRMDEEYPSRRAMVTLSVERELPSQQEYLDLTRRRETIRLV